MSRAPFAALCLLALATAACGSGPDDGAAAGPPPSMPPMDVQTVMLAAEPIPITSNFIATVRSLRSTTIQPQVDGFVRRILVRAGQRVTAGQPLVQIDPDLRQAAATVTESQRAAREADLELARQQLARVRELYEGGAVSRAALDEAEAVHKSAEAQLNGLMSQIHEDEVQLQYYRVTAPAEGIVGDLQVREGDRVTQATVITTIEASEGLEAYINVPVERAPELRPGLVVEFLDADGAVVASNPITFIAPRADDATQSVLVKVALQDRPPDVRVLQYLRARIVWSTDPALAVPVSGVLRVGGQFFVYVAEQAEGGFVARQRAVALADIVGEAYVVQSGVQAGERVIVSNLQKIGDGSPVNPS